jgi:ribonuclease Z
MIDNRTQIILLGTGNPNPDPTHSGPSVAIIAGGQPYLIDFGPGLIRQAASRTPQFSGNMPELDCKNFKTAFLTHLHSDHTIGLPDLLLTPWVMGRDQPLEIFGPRGTKKLAEHVTEAYQDDIQYRLSGHEPANQEGWRAIVHEINEGPIYEDSNIQVDAFLVKHGSMPNAFGYRFKTQDRVIILSGDTAPCSNMIEYGQGADYLIHEVYSNAGYQTLDPIWQHYHKSHHTSTHELAQIANAIEPGNLITYHTLYWGTGDQDILDEIKSIYNGLLMIGKDFLTI